MNEQIGIELVNRPQYDGGTVEYVTLFKGHTYHVPCKGDVLTFGGGVYIVHEVCWNFGAIGAEDVQVYLTYDGEL